MTKKEVEILKLQILDFFNYKNSVKDQVFNDLPKEDYLIFEKMFIGLSSYFKLNFETYKYDIISRKDISGLFNSVLFDENNDFFPLSEEQKSIMINSDYFLKEFELIIKKDIEYIAVNKDFKREVPSYIESIYLTKFKYMESKKRIALFEKLCSVYMLNINTVLSLIFDKNDLMFFVKNHIQELNIIVQVFFDNLIEENYGSIKNKNNLSEYNFLEDLTPYLDDNSINVDKIKWFTLLNKIITNGKTDYTIELTRIINKELLITKFQSSDNFQNVSVSMFGIRKLNANKKLIKEILGIDVEFPYSENIIGYNDFVYDDRMFILSLNKSDSNLDDVISFIKNEKGFELKDSGLKIKDDFKELLMANFKN